MNEDQLDQLNTKFETSTPQEILSWAIKTYSPQIALSSSFGGQSTALIHMAVQIDPKIPILFLNTGFLFKETIQFVNDLRKQFNLNVLEFKASPEQIEKTKKNLENKSYTGVCCDDSKVSLMEQSLKGLDCWVAGLRRSQGSMRKDIKIVELYGSGLLKVHPLANWSGKDLFNYMKQHGLPFHPLWDKGYTSIGCEPCTALPGDQGERSGRWTGTQKTECGIHTFLKKEN
ncbi:MAG: phosphoadenylyl-sulfate reductase [Elusimicrobiota bacterium]